MPESTRQPSTGTDRRGGLLADLSADLGMILGFWDRPRNLRNVLWACFACDAFIVLVIYRLRIWLRRHHVPIVNRLLRIVEMSLFSIELGNDIELGRGVFFMHTVGTVVGGTSKIGDGCIFLGNNTIGASTDKGCPNIGAHTVIGAGARVLGKIEIGERCMLGANAVVVRDIPAGKVATGIPAKVVGDYQPGMPVARYNDRASVPGGPPTDTPP